jgi:hypothetical protein
MGELITLSPNRYGQCKTTPIINEYLKICVTVNVINAYPFFMIFSIINDWTIMNGICDPGYERDICLDVNPRFSLSF